jgi:ATP-dependent Clp protease ATP-binding subunit ClpA
VGSEHFRKLTSPLGFLSQQVGADSVRADVMRELERRFPPEFRNRIDDVVLFSPLAHEETREIAKQYLDSVRQVLTRADKTFIVEDAALEAIVTEGYSLQYGARYLKRVIDERVKVPVSMRWRQGSHFAVRLQDGEVVVDVASKDEREERIGSRPGLPSGWPHRIVA